MNDNTSPKTRVYGRPQAVVALVDKHGGDMNPDGGKGLYGADSHIAPFTGGYDDYAGSLCWAIVHAEIVGPRHRISPNPGWWTTAVRV